MSLSAEITVYRTRSLRRSQRWAWRLVAANGRTIAVSSEGYGDQAEALDRAWSIVRGDYDCHAVIQT